MNTSFEEIYRENYTRLYTLAFRLSGNKCDAEDILQNSFLSAYKTYDRFRNESSFYTWLYRIVSNESSRYMKKLSIMPVDRYAAENKMEVNDVFEYVNSYGDTEDQAMAEASMKACLQLFLNCMPAAYKRVFTLREILGFSTSETSEILDMKENTVKVYLHRSRNFLQENMQGKCSLINPESPCRCSTWAKYAADTNQKLFPEDIELIRKTEKTLMEIFKKDRQELCEISELYNVLIKPAPYDNFIQHIKAVIESGDNILL